MSAAFGGGLLTLMSGVSIMMQKVLSDPNAMRYAPLLQLPPGHIDIHHIDRLPSHLLAPKWYDDGGAEKRPAGTAETNDLRAGRQTPAPVPGGL